MHIIARSDDELLDDFFHEQSSTGGQAGIYYHRLQRIVGVGFIINLNA